MGLSLSPVWRPSALVEDSIKVTKKLNCLFSPCGEGEGHVPLKQPCVHGLSPPEGARFTHSGKAA